MLVEREQRAKLKGCTEINDRQDSLVCRWRPGDRVCTWPLQTQTSPNNTCTTARLSVKL
jgi:hypothetical protein